MGGEQRLSFKQECFRQKIPTSRKMRETWGTRHPRIWISRVPREIPSRGLLVWSGSLSGGNDSHAGGIEDEGFYFGFGAVGGDFLAVPEEGDSGGVADAGDDFSEGVDGGVSGGDESFLADELSVGEDGNP